MRILMLGNSFTFFNNMPQMLAELAGAEVVHHTRGGARLAEQLNSKTKMGAMTLTALQNEKWDYVILQEMSNGPISSKSSFLNSVAGLCELIRENGAVPVLYVTWAYQRDGEKMQSMPYSYEEMYEQLTAAYHEAAEANDALVADVGKRFYELADKMDLYAEDGVHPNETGSRIAAEIIAGVCRYSGI